MVNTKHGRFTAALWRSLGVFLLSIPMGSNAVEIRNGVPEGTVGHYRVDVTTGGETRTAFVTAARFASNDTFTTDVVFDYASFVDPGIDGGDSGFSGRNQFQTPITRTSLRAPGRSSGSTRT